MRKAKLLLAAFAAMFTAQVSAQTWTASEVGEGSFYLYNVGAKGYLVAGNNYGTRASISPAGGILVTLTANEDGSYVISTSPTFNNKHLGLNGYVDNSAADQNWTFTPMSGAYEIKTPDGNVFFADEGATTTSVENTDPEAGALVYAPRNEYQQWKLVTREDRIADLKKATKTSPMDATFLLDNPNFDRESNAGLWTGSPALGGKQENFCAECFNKVFDVSQKVTDAPQGNYKLAFQGFYRMGGHGIGKAAEARTNGTEELNAVLYANASSTPLMSILDETTCPEGVEATGFEGLYPNTMDHASAAFSLGLYSTTMDFAVTENELTIGVKKEVKVENDWTIFDNARLTYYGPLTDLKPFIQMYEQALAAAQAIDQTAKMSTAAKSAIVDALNDYSDVDQTSQADLEEATKALKEATAIAKKSIAAYQIIAAGSIPDNSLDGWTCTNTNQFHINTWSSEGNSDGSNMKTPFIENWVGKGSFLGEGTVSYTLEGLEPGEMLYASALVRVYNEASSEAPNGPTFFINDSESDLSVVGTPFEYNGMSGSFATLGASASVGTDGKITLGVRIDADRNYNWVAFKNVRISSLSDALAAAVKAAENVGAIPTAAKQQLENTVNANNKTWNTAAEYEKAIAAISDAVATAQALEIPYAEWLTEKAIYDELAAADNDNEAANQSLKNAINNASSYIEQQTDAEAFERPMEEVKDAAIAYVKKANPVGNAKFNMTFMLTNPNLDKLPSWNKCEGWYTDQPDGNSQVMNNDNATSEDGTKTKFYEYWSGSAKQNGEFALYQLVELPEGTYKLSCYAFARQQDGNTGDKVGVYFYANDTQGSAVSQPRLSQATIDFVNETEQEVKIGLKTISPNSYNWMGIGYVELFKVASVDLVIDEDVAFVPESAAGKVTLKREIIANQWNSISLPFALTNDELMETFGAAVMVAEYNESQVMDITYDEETGDEIQTPVEKESTVSFDVMDTPVINANMPVLLYPTVGGSEFIFMNRSIAEGEAKVIGTNFDFVGNYGGEIVLPQDNYFLYENQIYESTGKSKVKGTRAYIAPKSAQARLLRVEIDGVSMDATAINGLVVNNASNDNIYNLAGQRVMKTQKGLYIQNGKKVVVK